MSEQMMICENWETCDSQTCVVKKPHSHDGGCLGDTCFRSGKKPIDIKCVPYVPSQPVKPEMSGLLTIIEKDNVVDNVIFAKYETTWSKFCDWFIKERQIDGEQVILDLMDSIALAQLLKCQQQEQERLSHWIEQLNMALILHFEIKPNGNVMIKGGAIQDILKEMIKEQKALKAKYQSSKGGK